MPTSSGKPAFLHPYAKPTRESFIRIVRGEGALVWDSDGHELVDGMASLWYCSAGHGRAEIADAIGAQARQLGAYSCFDPFTNEPADRLAEDLCAIAPMKDARVFLCSSGSEAIDTSMKLARIAHVQAGEPQRKLIISRSRGYHGVAYGGTSAQGIAPNKENFGPFVDSVVQVPADDIEALATLMHERSDEIAAVLTEPVQGAAGIYPPPDGYLTSLRRLCDQHGAYLIFDEVITGFGRLGSWFASHHYDVRPDLVTFAKAVTSGYQPLGGVFVGPAPRAALESDQDFFLRHGFTPTPVTRRHARLRSPTSRSSVARTSSHAPRTSAIACATGCGRSLRTGSSITRVARGRCGPPACVPTRTRPQCATRCSPAASSPARSTQTPSRSARRS